MTPRRHSRGRSSVTDTSLERRQPSKQTATAGCLRDQVRCLARAARHRDCHYPRETTHRSRRSGQSDTSLSTAASCSSGSSGHYPTNPAMLLAGQPTRRAAGKMTSSPDTSDNLTRARVARLVAHKKALGPRHFRGSSPLKKAYAADSPGVRARIPCTTALPLATRALKWGATTHMRPLPARSTRVGRVAAAAGAPTPPRRPRARRAREGTRRRRPRRREGRRADPAHSRSG